MLLQHGTHLLETFRGKDKFHTVLHDITVIQCVKLSCIDSYLGVTVACWVASQGQKSYFSKELYPPTKHAWSQCNMTIL